MRAKTKTGGNRVNKCAAAALIIALLALMSSSQVTEVRVQIVNSPPKAYDVRATPVVKSGQTDIVWCTGVLEDLNSYKDFKTQSAFIGVPSSGGYIQRQESDLFNAEQVSIIKGQIVSGFVLPAQTTPGDWACVIQGSDNADAKASNSSTFKIAPQTCANKVKDQSEENVDCGGPCIPCHCYNGVKDENEAGIDCGGQCLACTDKGPMTITAPEAITSGEVISVQVKSGNKGMISLIRATKPSGKTIVFKTEESGILTLPSDETGTWNITADMYGYKPALVQVQVKTSMITYLIAAVIMLAVAVLILIVVKSRKKTPPQQPQIP
jgi:hypothetical protein